MTNAELAILGLVVEQPRHGYEIERVIDERGMRNWTEIGFSSIYYLLKRLESKGLISATVDARRTKGPARKVFGATREGRTAWRRETRRALAAPRRQYPEIFLGMAGMPGLTSDEIVEALAEYRHGLRQRREQIAQARERSGPQLPRHVEAMFTYSVTMIAAELSWVEAFIHESETKKEHV